MGPYYNRPENALKRTDELIAVNQPSVALSLLYDVVTSRKIRGTAPSMQEQIYTRYIDLCVQLRKGQMAREGLLVFKNQTQNVDVHYIERMINHFILSAEAQVAGAQKKADLKALDVDDLEATETPESIILSTVSAEGERERSDSEIVTPWLKFLWESYRIALEVVKNNSRMESLYHTVARKAFGFCLRFQRKTEFRRLCDILRNHLTLAVKAQQSYSINLNDATTLQSQMDTRFRQLNAATELELWQEAFRTIEDLHSLINLSLRMPRPQMWVNYFERMAQIFMVGHNYLFHAAALSRYFGILRHKKDLPQDELSRVAGRVMLAAMSIPIINTTSRAVEENKPRLLKLSNLVRMPKPPMRESLLRDSVSKGLLTLAAPEIQQLHEILEVRFHPLQICKRVEPIIKLLAANEDFCKYVKPLHEVIITRVLQQLSQVYSCIKMDAVSSLCAFAEPYAYSQHDIEKFIMVGCKRGEFSMRIDHEMQTVHFKRDSFSSIGSADYDANDLTHANGSVIVELARQQLSILASKLETAWLLIDQSEQQAERAAFVRAQEALLRAPERDHAFVRERLQMAEAKKFKRESEQARIAKEEADERHKKMLREQEAERARLKEEQTRREKERLLQERQRLLDEEVARKASALVVTEHGKMLNLKDLGKLKPEELTDLAEKQARQAEQERVTKVRALAKRVDHLERAFRKEEIPLLQADYERQKTHDRKAFETEYADAVAQSREQHARALEARRRMARMMEDYRDLRQRVEIKHASELKRLRADAAAQLEQAKQERREAIKREREDQRQLRREDLRRMREREDQERREAAAAEAKAAERELARQKADEEHEARQAKLDEIAEKQREAERRAEERLLGMRGGAGAGAGAEAAAPQVERWRPSRAREAAPPAAMEGRFERDSEPSGPAPSAPSAPWRPGPGAGPAAGPAAGGAGESNGAPAGVYRAPGARREMQSGDSTGRWR